MIHKLFEFLIDLVVANGGRSTLHIHVEGWLSASLALAMFKHWCKKGKRGGVRKRKS
jgi:hypothetical protein